MLKNMFRYSFMAASFVAIVTGSFACTSGNTRAQTLDSQAGENQKDPKGTCSQEDFLGQKAASKTYSLTSKQVSAINNDDVDIELATSLVNAVASKKGCTTGERGNFVISFRGSECKTISAEFERESLACFVKTNVADFFVVTDADGGAQVIARRLFRD